MKRVLWFSFLSNIIEPCEVILKNVYIFIFRLWHQLTLKVEEFVKNPALHKGDALIQLYNNFIYVFENRWV